MEQDLSDDKEDARTGLSYHLILGRNNYLWIPAFEFAVSRLPPDVSGFNVLDIGAGTGGLSLYFAKRGCHVICSDINRSNMTKAQEFHRTHECVGDIEYDTIDILNNDLLSESFDIICFKSVLGAIPKNKQNWAISEIHRLLRKKGTLVFCENLRGSYLSESYRKLFAPWYKRWNYVTISEMQQYLSPYAESKVDSFWFAAVFLKEVLKSNLIGIGLDRTVLRHLRNEYRYIMAGFAIA